MADDSTTGIRGVAGTAGSPNDGTGDQIVPAASICHVVHEEQVGELNLSRENRRAAARERRLLLARPRPARPRTTSRSCATSSSSTRSRSRTRSTSASGRRSTTTTTSSSSSSTAPSPTSDRLVEVHCFYSERFLVTVHRDDCPGVRRDPPALREAREADRRARRCCSTGSSTASSTASSRSSPTSTTASTSSRTQIFLHADDTQLQEIFQMKRLLVGMRKAVTPQRDMFASLMGGVAELPGTDDGGRALLPRHLRPPDPDQRPDRQLPRPAHGRDGRLPLDRLQPAQRGDEAAGRDRDHLPAAHACITGFFGQNFGWLVGHIGGWPAFVGSASAPSSSAVAILLVFFKRRGWF